MHSVRLPVRGRFLGMVCSGKAPTAKHTPVVAGVVLKWAGVVRRGGGDDLTPWLAIREREVAAVAVVGAAVDARLCCHAMANQHSAGARRYDDGREAWKAPRGRSVPST